jgi:hypothetical protein
LKINDRLNNESKERKVVERMTLLKESREELKKALRNGTNSPSAMGGGSGEKSCTPYH